LLVVPALLAVEAPWLFSGTSCCWAGACCEVGSGSSSAIVVPLAGEGGEGKEQAKINNSKTVTGIDSRGTLLLRFNSTRLL
jgi:hypothetical protein